MNVFGLFFTALTFYTRLPGLRWAAVGDEALGRASAFAPLVGLVVGGMAAAVFLAASLVLPAAISVLLSMAASLWVTGAFHEDGLADMCDGFGGGWSKGDVLRIMKDSRIGTYGAVGLLVALLLKFQLLTAIVPQRVPAVLLCAHAVSRLLPVVIMWRLPYARDDDSSKVRPVAQGVGFAQVLVASVFGLAPLALVPDVAWAVSLCIAASVWLAWRCQRRLGGYTGDTLGAAQQISELAFLIGVVATWHTST